MAKKQAIDIVVKAHDQASRRLRTMQQEARRVYEGTRKPAEKYGHTMSRLEGLLKRGAISQQTFNRAVAQARTRLDGASKQASRFGGILKKAVGMGLTYFGGRMMLRGIGSAINAAVEYERQIASVSTMLSGEGMKSLEMYRKGIAEMAVKHGESTGVLSKGLYDILSAGIAAGGAMDVLEVASKAAIGGMTDTAVAVDGITTALNAYRLSARHATRVSDVMAKIVIGGKINFAELAENIGKIAPTAKVAGISLENLGAMIATIVQIEKPERAMTSLVALMMEAAKRGRTLLEIVEEFKGKGLPAIMDAGYNKKAATAVGILGSSYEELTKQIKEFGNAAGTAEEQYGKMADKVYMRQKRMEEQWKAQKKTIGELLMPAVEAWLDGMDKILEQPSKIAQSRMAAHEELKKLQKMPMLTFAGREGIVEDMKQLEERLSKAKKVVDVLGEAMMKTGRKSEFLNRIYKEAYKLWQGLSIQETLHAGTAEKIEAADAKRAEAEKKEASAAAARAAQRAQWEKSNYEIICQRHADEMNLHMQEGIKVAELQAKKEKAEEEEYQRRKKMMKTRAEQIEKAVMTPAEKFKQAREELTQLKDLGLLDEEQFGRALQAALKRAGKTTADWPVTRQLAAYEARILTRGRVRDRNDPAMQQVRIQQDIAKNTEEQKKISMETRDLLRQQAAEGRLNLKLVEIT